MAKANEIDMFLSQPETFWLVDWIRKYAAPAIMAAPDGLITPNHHEHIADKLQTIASLLDEKARQRRTAPQIRLRMSKEQARSLIYIFQVAYLRRIDVPFVPQTLNERVNSLAVSRKRGRPRLSVGEHEKRAAPSYGIAETRDRQRCRSAARAKKLRARSDWFDELARRRQTLMCASADMIKRLELIENAKPPRGRPKKGT